MLLKSFAGAATHRSKRLPSTSYEHYNASSCSPPQRLPVPFGGPIPDASPPSSGTGPMNLQPNDPEVQIPAQLSSPARSTFAAKELSILHGNGRVDVNQYTNSDDGSPAPNRMPGPGMEIGDNILLHPVREVSVELPEALRMLNYSLSQSTNNSEEEDMEDLVRSEHEWWTAPSISATSSNGQLHPELGTSLYDTFRQPAVRANSPELLFLHFDKHTCGIMSMKDGPTENPWRTFIWPLALDSPALYHALSSMTVFHMSKRMPWLQVEGIKHLQKSVMFLNQGFSHDNIGEDAAIATTLVLAFSEAFDRHISSGKRHLQGARFLLCKAFTKRSFDRDSLQRLNFLYNVWVYLDVLARLTSDGDSDGSLDPTGWYVAPTREIDPLLGCAATLFPLIGRTASLVQRVRRSEKNSVGIIEDAMELKSHLEAWSTGEYYVQPEDTSSEVEHCITTAEAYRWVTLLYLHQAVPELHSPSAHDLAEKVMRLIASIPMDSRSCIVHIYPLLVAGCEAVGGEERNWVEARWKRMRDRMLIGNVDKAWEVVKEVWRRRDEFQNKRPAIVKLGSFCRVMEYQQPSAPDDIDEILLRDPETSVVDGNALQVPGWCVMTDSITGRPLIERAGRRSRDILQGPREGDLEFEVSVKGKLHWLGVMKQWGWEGATPQTSVPP
jgi:hypothetical protein